MSDDIVQRLRAVPSFWSQDGIRWYKSGELDPFCIAAAYEIERLRAEVAAVRERTLEECAAIVQSEVHHAAINGHALDWRVGDGHGFTARPGVAASSVEAAIAAIRALAVKQETT